MAVNASGTYSLLGINSDYISIMQDAIRKYKQGIDEPLSQLSSNLEYADGFKGSSIAESMKKYLESVIEKMKQMTAYIDNFDASLAQVAINYGEEAETISTTISTDADNVEGQDITTTTGVSGFNEGAPGNGSSPISFGGPGGVGIKPPNPTPVPPIGVGGPGGVGIKPPNPTPVPPIGVGGPGGLGIEPPNPTPVPPIGQDGASPDGNFNNNGIDISHIADNEDSAVSGDFIPEDNIYAPSFESDGVTFHEGENGGILIENDGVPIGWTDVIGGQNP